MRSKSPLSLTKKIGLGVVLILLVFFGLWGFNRYSAEEDNKDIAGLVLMYFRAIDNREYSLVESFYTPTHKNETSAYIQNMQTRAQEIGLKTIRAEKIYPALVSGSIGVVGVITETQALYQGKDLSFKELHLLLLRKVDGRWHIAKPEDAKDYDPLVISDLFEKYKSVVGDDADIAAVKESQQEAFAVLKGSAK